MPIKSKRSSQSVNSRFRDTVDQLSVAHIFLKVIIYVVRFVALLYLLFVVINFSGWVVARLHATGFTFMLTHMLPEALSGKWVFPTPLDGLFRTDFAIMGIILLIIDWVFCLIADRK